jgi:predicted Na+-dependent transporter
VARDIYLALMPVGPLYFGLASAQFLPGSKWLGALKGVVAWLKTYALTLALVFVVSNAVQWLTGH